MKRLVAAVLLVVLAGVPSIAQANVTRASPPAARTVPGLPAAAPAPSAESRAEATDYAAREALDPALGEFRAGGGGLYIGGSALTIVLLVLLIVILV